jgi:hypothetical protein
MIMMEVGNQDGLEARKASWRPCVAAEVQNPRA